MSRNCEREARHDDNNDRLHIHTAITPAKRLAILSGLRMLVSASWVLDGLENATRLIGGERERRSHEQLAARAKRVESTVGLRVYACPCVVARTCIRCGTNAPAASLSRGAEFSQRARTMTREDRIAARDDLAGNRSLTTRSHEFIPLAFVTRDTPVE